MTFCIGIATKRLAFVAADRKYSGAPSLSDFAARKICRLETLDAQGVLTYAGVGARANARPLELSEWLVNVLRGHRLNLDQALNLIMSASIEQKLHEYSPRHTFIYSGFKSTIPILQVITTDNSIQSNSLQLKGERVDHTLQGTGFKRVNIEIGKQPATMYVAGSGSGHLRRPKFMEMIRFSLRAGSKEDEARRISSFLSAITRDISLKEPTVSSDIICAWTYKEGGGSYSRYDKLGKRLENNEMIPSIANGIPVTDLINLIAPVIDRQFSFMRNMSKPANPPEIDKDEMNNLLQNLNLKPNKKF